MKPSKYKNRADAGEILGELLAHENYVRPLVLALPRGGVPLGSIVARKLGAPLDLILVRKIGVPGYDELAAGAVVDGDPPVLVFNDDVMRSSRLTEEDLAEKIKAKISQIKDRRSRYFSDAKPLPVTDMTAIIVDDGMATGATALAAVRGLRERKPARIILAVAVASQEALARLEPEVDEIVCPLVPSPFYAVGAHYTRFGQVSDEEVIETLTQFRLNPISL